MKPPIYIASCSFGKDSIATILLALENGEPLDRVVFAEVLFDHAKYGKRWEIMAKTSKHTTRGEKRAKNRAKYPKTASNDVFTFYIRQKLGVECVREYRFHPSRMWRFDYAIPPLRIAIEIDGGIWINGRHNRASGYLGDMEKFNAAATLGWVVLKFTPQEQYTRKAFDLISETIKTQQHEKDDSSSGNSI